MNQAAIKLEEVGALPQGAHGKINPHTDSGTDKTLPTGEDRAKLFHAIGRRFSVGEFMHSMWHQATFRALSLHRGSDEHAYEGCVETQTNCSIVAALMFGVAMSGFLTPPTPSEDSHNHLGLVFGSPVLNTVLWCISSIFFLMSTLSSVFFIAMLKQVDVTMFKVFEDAMGTGKQVSDHLPRLLNTPIILCYVGIFFIAGAFLSFLTIIFGETSTACCIFGCIPMIVGITMYAQSKVVFATEIAMHAQAALGSRRDVTLQPAQIVLGLEQYVAEQGVETINLEGFLDYITPNSVADLSHCETRAERRFELLPKPVLAPLTMQVAEAIFNRLIQEHIESVTASADLSVARQILESNITKS